MKFIIFVFLVVLNISCNSKLENIEDVIVEQEYLPVKLSLTINLTKRINHEELEALAEKIYKKYDGENYDNVFMIYLLPQMEQGNEAYASSHYNPNMDLVIHELTEEEISKINDKFPGLDRYWIDRKLLFEIKLENGKYLKKSYGNDLSTSEKALLKRVEGNDTIYSELINEHQDYYRLDNNNRLSVYDDRGYIKSYLSE